MPTLNNNEHFSVTTAPTCLRPGCRCRDVLALAAALNNNPRGYQIQTFYYLTATPDHLNSTARYEKTKSCWYRFWSMFSCTNSSSIAISESHPELDSIPSSNHSITAIEDRHHVDVIPTHEYQIPYARIQEEQELNPKLPKAKLVQSISSTRIYQLT